MNPEQAKRILNVSEDDDKAEIKRKYHRLMSAFHPDAAGLNEPGNLRRAQEINAAYSVLKKDVKIPVSKKKRKAWQGEMNEKAFCDRNLYLYYSMDVPGEHLYYQAAMGKYIWNPDEEEFELFLTSIRHASRELLDKTEENAGVSGDSVSFSETEKFRYQAQLFQSLAAQFIYPAATLRKIAEPVSKDRQEREIYCFKAFLETKEKNEKTAGHTAGAVAGLKAGDVLYPASFQGNKIAVADREKKMLGYLSLEDDRLYFCVIPLLKRRLAQVKITVKETQAGRRTKTCRVKTEVKFFFRMEKEADSYTDGGQSLEIADILRRYEAFLRNEDRGEK